MDKHHDKVGADGQLKLLGRCRSEIPDAERLQAFQGKLYQKARQEKKFRFYVLYDKMFVPYILRESWIPSKT